MSIPAPGPLECHRLGWHLWCTNLPGGWKTRGERKAAELLTQDFGQLPLATFPSSSWRSLDLYSLPAAVTPFLSNGNISIAHTGCHLSPGHQCQENTDQRLGKPRQSSGKNQPGLGSHLGMPGISKVHGTPLKSPMPEGTSALSPSSSYWEWVGISSRQLQQEQEQSQPHVKHRERNPSPARQESNLVSVIAH